MKRTLTAALIPLFAFLSACSGDVTESDEYQALQAQLDEQAAELETTQAELAATQADLEETQASLEDATTSVAAAETSLEETETALTDAEARAEEAETALDEELNRPWPEEVKNLFVAGCAEAPEEGLTVEQSVQICQCMLDDVEQEVSLVDFMIFSSAAADPNAELSPITGFPVGLDPEFVETIIGSAGGCILEL